MNEQSHYEVLAVDMFASSSEIQAGIERLSRQANAIANTDPERSRAIREQIRRIKEDLLSGEERRSAYNRKLVATGKADLIPNAPSSAWEPEIDAVEQGPRGRKGEVKRSGMPVHPRPPGKRASGWYWLVATVILLALAVAGGAVAARALTHPTLAIAPTAPPTPPQIPSVATASLTATERPSVTAESTAISQVNAAPTLTTSSASDANVLYDAQFDRGMPGWLANSSGRWQTTGSEMTYSGTGKGAILAPFAMAAAQSFAVEASMESGHCTGTSHGFGIYVRASDDANDSTGIFGGLWSSGALIWTAQHGDYVRAPFDAGSRWWTVRVEVTGDHIRLLADGTLLTEAVVPQFQSLPRVGVGASYCAARVRTFRILALSTG